MLVLLIGVLASLIAAFLIDVIGHVSETILRRAARRLPQSHELFLEDWIANVRLMPGPLSRLWFAVSIYYRGVSGMCEEVAESLVPNLSLDDVIYREGVRDLKRSVLLETLGQQIALPLCGLFMLGAAFSSGRELLSLFFLCLTAACFVCVPVAVYYSDKIGNVGRAKVRMGAEWRDAS